MKDLIELTKEFNKEDDITLYTIALADGQELIITEGEFEQLKEKINNIN